MALEAAEAARPSRPGGAFVKPAAAAAAADLAADAVQWHPAVVLRTAAAVAAAVVAAAAVAAAASAAIAGFVAAFFAPRILAAAVSVAVERNSPWRTVLVAEQACGVAASPSTV